MKQYIPYSFICHLLSRNLETYLHYALYFAHFRVYLNMDTYVRGLVFVLEKLWKLSAVDFISCLDFFSSDMLEFL